MGGGGVYISTLDNTRTSCPHNMWVYVTPTMVLSLLFSVMLKVAWYGEGGGWE